MRKCKDYERGEKWEGETNPDAQHPKSCYGCKHLYRVPYECWSCTAPNDQHYVEEVPYPVHPKSEGVKHK